VQPAELTEDEGTMLEHVVQHQIEHPGNEAPLDELRLLFDVPDEAKARSNALSLAARVLLFHRDERGYESFAATPEGLLASRRTEQVQQVCLSILRVFQEGIKRQRTEFGEFTLGQLGLSSPEEYAVAQLVVRAFELHGHLHQELTDLGVGTPTTLHPFHFTRVGCPVSNSHDNGDPQTSLRSDHAPYCVITLSRNG
jgi:hypothetical protein